VQEIVDDHKKTAVTEAKVKELLEAQKKALVSEQQVQDLLEEAQKKTLVSEHRMKELLQEQERISQQKLQELLESHKRGLVSEQRVQEIVDDHKKTAVTEAKVKELLEAQKKALVSEQQVQDLLDEQKKSALTEAKVQDLIEAQKKALVSEQTLQELLKDHKVQAESKAQEIVEAQKKGLVSEQRLHELLNEHKKDLEEHRQSSKAREDRLHTLVDQHTRTLVTEQRVKEMLQEHRQSSANELQEMLAAEKKNLVSEQRLQEMVDEQKKSTVSESRVQQLLEAQQAGTLSEEQVRDLILAQISGAPRTPLTRPPTSPGPFAASQQSLSTSQSKAAWSSVYYNAMAAVPDSDAQSTLTYKSLEHGLVERALSVQPRHSIDKMVVHDTVNAVVRDIVGIFESLLDRLLIEKKHDTIRTIVAELVTEDIAATIASGREQLKRQELGHIVTEMGRLRTELREAETAWEERFRVTTELRDSQDDLWATLDDRCKVIESRLGVVEREFVHGSELDTRMKAVTEEFDSLRDTVSTNKVKVDRALEKFDGFQSHCTETFVNKGLLDSLEQRLDKSLESLHSHVDTSLHDLRNDCAQRSEVTDLQTAHDERLRNLSSDLFHITQDVDLLKTQLKKDQRQNTEIFATKIEQQAVVSRLTEQREEMERNIRSILTELEESSVTKKAFEVEQKHQEDKLGNIMERASDTAKSVDLVTQRVESLEKLCDSAWATREYVNQVSEEQAKKVALELSEKETIAQMRREFEEERERLRQQTRQQQSTRKDLNDLSETVHGVKRQALDAIKGVSSLTERMDRVVSSEADHWQKVLSDSAELRHNHSDLELLFQALRDELTSHIEHQKAESDKLRQHSTQRYLEQIDKALALNQTVGKLESGHKELRETVTKLPRVA